MKLTTKKSKEYCNDLVVRFLEGEKLTSEQIIKEFFPNVRNYEDYLKTKIIVKGWLANCKRIFTKEYDLWFGCLDEISHYGICQTPKEYVFVLNRYRNHFIGNIRRTMQLYNEGSKKNMLPGITRQPYMLPMFPVSEELDKKKK